VPNPGHVQLEEDVGGRAPPLLVGRAQLAPQGQNRFRARLVEDFAAGGTEEVAVGGAGVAGGATQVVRVGDEVGGDGFPRRPAGAAGGGAFEQFGIDDGCAGHGGTGGRDLKRRRPARDVTRCSIISGRGKSNRKVFS